MNGKRAAFIARVKSLAAQSGAILAARLTKIMTAVIGEARQEIGRALHAMAAAVSGTRAKRSKKEATHDEQ